MARTFVTVLLVGLLVLAVQARQLQTAKVLNGVLQGSQVKKCGTSLQELHDVFDATDKKSCAGQLADYAELLQSGLKFQIDKGFDALKNSSTVAGTMAKQLKENSNWKAVRKAFTTAGVASAIANPALLEERSTQTTSLWNCANEVKLRKHIMEIGLPGCAGLQLNADLKRFILYFPGLLDARKDKVEGKNVEKYETLKKSLMEAMTKLTNSNVMLKTGVGAARELSADAKALVAAFDSQGNLDKAWLASAKPAGSSNVAFLESASSLEVTKWTPKFKTFDLWTPLVCPKGSTPAQLAAFKKGLDATNGCSVPGDIPWFYKQTFTDACQIHDFGYRCGDYLGHTRKVIDQQFFVNMLNLCWTRYCKRFKQAFQRNWCVVFTLGWHDTVRLFGKSHWDLKSQNKSPFCETPNADNACVHRMTNLWQMDKIDKFC